MFFKLDANDFVFLDKSYFEVFKVENEPKMWFFNFCRRLMHGISGSSHRRCSVKKVLLKFRKFHRKTPVLDSLFNKVAGVFLRNLRNFQEHLF